MTARRLTVSDVAALAGVTEQAIRCLNHSGRMPAGELTPDPGPGLRWTWDEQVILDWLPTRAKPGRPRKDRPLTLAPEQTAEGTWRVRVSVNGSKPEYLLPAFATEGEAQSFIATLLDGARS